MLARGISMIHRSHGMSSTMLLWGQLAFYHFSRHSDATVERLAFVHSAEHLPVALRYTALDSGLDASHLSTSFFAISLSVWAVHLCWGGCAHGTFWASLLVVTSTLLRSVKVTSPSSLSSSSSSDSEFTCCC